MTKPHRNEAEREAAKKKSKKEHYERKKKDPNFLAMKAQRERERRKAKEAELELAKHEIEVLKHEIEVLKLENENKNEAARVSAIGSAYTTCVSVYKTCVDGINATRDTSRTPLEEGREEVELRNEITAEETTALEAPLEEERDEVVLRNETTAEETRATEPPLEEEREIVSPNNAPRRHLRSSGFRNEYIDFSEGAAASSFQLGVPRSQIEDVIRHGKILKQNDDWTTYVRGNVEVLVFDDVDHQSWTVDSITKEDRHMSRVMKANDFGRYPLQKSDMDLYERGRLATAKKFSKLENVANDLWESEETSKSFEVESKYWEDRCLKAENHNHDYDSLKEIAEYDRKEHEYWKDRCLKAEDHNHDYEIMKDIAKYDSKEHKYWKDRCLKVENHYRHGHDHNHDERCANDDCGRDYVESSVESHSCDDDESYVSGSGKRYRSPTTLDSGCKRSKTFHQYD